ncbi:hypothetical protein B0H16DRAFT_1692217 [Mycena metata]|uniref:N-acetyltransferase domain-containing protein n=1 Tax=Mycena metata TaxID=1033252 RepID=A0AAD7N5Z8_9AGAR|nr:hypothetical protein B0H16DRAFT_1692217 [Mycena metata]
MFIELINPHCPETTLRPRTFASTRNSYPTSRLPNILMFNSQTSSSARYHAQIALPGRTEKQNSVIFKWLQYAFINTKFRGRQVEFQLGSFKSFNSKSPGRPEQQQHAREPLTASWDKELQGGGSRPDSFLAPTLGEGTKHASWHLQTLAVDPEYQRKGAGRLLVNIIADEAAPTKTASSIEVYTKMGFHLMPKDNSGPDSCKATYTGVKGHSVPMWVLVMG